jgi:hypothetical protein
MSQPRTVDIDTELDGSRSIRFSPAEQGALNTFLPAKILVDDLIDAAATTPSADARPDEPVRERVTTGETMNGHVQGFEGGTSPPAEGEHHEQDGPSPPAARVEPTAQQKAALRDLWLWHHGKRQFTCKPRWARSRMR